MMRRIISLSALLLCCGTMISQYQIGLIPRVSPDKSVYQKIGYTEVEITYGSPAVKNREVWGHLAPYDQVWRAGANNATTVSISAPVQIQNNTLDSGRYALFIIPKEAGLWTVIFNHEPDQWGSFRYDSSKDALRVDVYPDHTPLKAEKLVYTIDQLGYQHGTITMHWDHTSVQIPFETDYVDSFIEQVERRAASQEDHIKWVVYIQGAEHLIALHTQLEMAEQWIDSAESYMNQTSEWNEQYYPRDYVVGHLYWTKAKIMAAQENVNEALSYADKLSELSNTLYYDRKKDSEDIDALVTSWRNQ